MGKFVNNSPSSVTLSVGRNTWDVAADASVQLPEGIGAEEIVVNCGPSCAWKGITPFDQDISWTGKEMWNGDESMQGVPATGSNSVWMIAGLILFVLLIVVVFAIIVWAATAKGGCKHGPSSVSEQYAFEEQEY